MRSDTTVGFAAIRWHRRTRVLVGCPSVGLRFTKASAPALAPGSNPHSKAAIRSPAFGTSSSASLSSSSLLRWLYRVVVWTRFLWHLSKIDLVLTPTHLDAAGGLMFLGEAVLPFGGIMFALSSVVANR